MIGRARRFVVAYSPRRSRLFVMSGAVALVALLVGLVFRPGSARTSARARCFAPWEALEASSEQQVCVRGIVTAIVPGLNRGGHIVLQAAGADGPRDKGIPNRGIFVDMFATVTRREDGTLSYDGPRTWYEALRRGQEIEVVGVLARGFGVMACHQVLRLAQASVCPLKGTSTASPCWRLIDGGDRLAEVPRIQIGDVGSDIEYPLSEEDRLTCHYPFFSNTKLGKGSTTSLEQSCKPDCVFAGFTGMLANFSNGRFVVTSLQKLARNGVVTLAYGGSKLVNPTQLHPPGNIAAKAAQGAEARKLHLDAGVSRENPSAILLPDGAALTSKGDIRGGDAVVGEGIIFHRFDASTSRGLHSPGWRVLTGAIGGLGEGGVRAEASAEIVRTSRRPLAPKLNCSGTDISIASFNCLNFFVTPQIGKIKRCGPGCQNGTCTEEFSKGTCRGHMAEYDPIRYHANGLCACNQTIKCTGLCESYELSELDRQKQKLSAALRGLDADVYVLQEVENDASNLAQKTLAEMAGPTYRSAFVEPMVSGVLDREGKMQGDVIKIAIVYNSATLEMLGQPAQLNNDWLAQDEQLLLNQSTCRGFVKPLFLLTRPVLAATVRVRATGGIVTVVALHLKSKRVDKGLQSKCRCDENFQCTVRGEPCDNCDAGDGQGAWQGMRARSVEIIDEWLASDPTGVKDIRSGNLVLMGDWNGYAQEAPLRVASRLGYRTVFADEDSFSFSFDGFWGSLDHAMVSERLYEAVQGRATKWNINSLEAPALRYPMAWKDSGAKAWPEMQWWAAEYGQKTTDGTAFPLWRTLFASDQYAASDHDPLLLCATV
eukprot:TRINITY_DN32036_c0_g1_i1.p1 TRINITY_DN32036_c0_g1~~TRINITY_DN32036_c0_g1_i1.p1  ORF type:complete len:827 (+),score=97.31 TRINITY_DN32036_c0_g1_i1:221-2701(+)